VNTGKISDLMNISWSGAIDIAGYYENNSIGSVQVFYFGAEINDTYGLFSLLDVSKAPPFPVFSSWNYLRDTFPSLLYLLSHALLPDVLI
jgi:hypothetical protein